MSTENDTVTGDGGLSMDEAAKAYVKATTSEAASDGQAEDDEDLEQADTTDDQLEPEGDGEEEGEPTDDDGQADDDETDDEPDSDQGRFVAANGKVRLPDGTVATVSDLIQGNLRDRDYRQKTMGLGEEKRTLATQSSALKQQETQLAQQRELLTQVLTSIAPPAPDPAMADPRSPNYNPAEYMANRAAYESFIGQIQQVEHMGADARQRAEQETAAKRQEKGNAEWATLVEKLPALKDQKRFENFVGDVRKYGKSYGFTDQELAESLGYDHRTALVMHKAIQWDKLQASKAKLPGKVEGRPPVQKSGKRLSTGDQRARSTTVAMDRLKQSGSVEDAARAYLLSHRKG